MSKSERMTKTNYKRPKQTFTDKLNMDKEAIMDQLVGYKQVETLEDVKLGTFVKYFSKMKDGTRKFRLGGRLINMKNLPLYVVLEAKKKMWSVQVKDTIFYVKQTIESVMEEYEEKIEKIEFKNKALKTLLFKLKKEIKQKDEIIAKLKK